MTASRRTALLTRSALCGVLGAMALGATPALASLDPANLLGGATNGGAPVITVDSPTQTTVTLNGSRTVIDWANFDIANGHTANFMFGAGGANSIVLNRVYSGAATTIDGNLNGCLATCATTGGNIWIYNADGVIFGANARVNVGGLLATTASLDNTLNGAPGGFLNSGTYSFTFSGSPTSSQIQMLAGSQITTTGSVALIAPFISQAAGSSIATPDGDVLIGAAEGFTIQFAPDAGNDLDLVTFAVPAATGTSRVTAMDLRGSISAGRAFVASVSKTGVTSQLLLSGTIVTTNASGGDGDIVLSAGGGIATGGVAGPATGGTNNLSISTTGAAYAAGGGDFSIVSSGNTTWTATGSGAIINSNLGIVAGGTATLSTAGGSISVDSVSGVSGVSVTVGGVGASALIGSATSSGGNVTVHSAAGMASLSTGSAAGDLRVQGTTASLGTGTAGLDLFVTATSGAATVTNSATAGDDVEITATSGAVSAGGATLRSTGVTAVDDGHILVRSTGGSVSVGSATTQGVGAAAGDVIIQAASSATLAAGSSSRDLMISGTSASLTTGDAARDLSVSASSGSATIATSATAGDDVTISGFGGVLATNATLTATGLGAADNANVNVTSANGAVAVGHARTLGTGSAAGDVTLQSQTSMGLTSITSSRNASLNAATGSITQSSSSGVITATSLTATSGSVISLIGANAVDTLNASASNGSFTFRNNGDFDIAGNIVTAGGLLTLISSSGAITQSAGILNAGGASVSASTGITLGQANSAGAVSLVNTASGGVTFRSATGITVASISNLGRAVTLTADGGSITQTNTLTAGTLNASATGAIILNNSGNAITQLGYITTGAGALNLRTSGNLDLTGNVATGAQPVTLTAGGAITQSGGTIAAGTLNASAANGITLNRANTLDAVGVLSNTTSGGISITDANNLDVTGNITAIGQAVTLTATTGRVQQTGSSTVAGTLNASAVSGITFNNLGNNVTNLGVLTNTGSGGVTYVDTDDYTLTGNVTAANQAINLSSANGAIGQTGAIISGGTLTTNAWTGVSLTQANQVGALGLMAAGSGNLSYRDADGFSLTGNVSATGTVSLTADSGAILQTAGAITADTLTASAGFTINLSQTGNNIVTLGALTVASGGFSYVDADSFDLNGAITAPGQTVTLRSMSGAITQGSSGTISAYILNAQAATGIALVRNNQVTSLGTVNAGTGGFFYRDVDDIALTGNISAGTSAGMQVSIISNTGAISQTGGVITGDTLTAQAATGITLGAENDLVSLGVMTSNGAITYRDADAVALTGAVTATGQIVNLRSTAGTITQTGGIITAGTLTATTQTGLSLTGANLIDNVGTVTINSGFFTLNNAKALTVSGNVNTTAALSLTADGGVNATGTLFGSGGVTVTATSGDAVVRSASANGTITVQANAGNATLRAASLGSASNGITVSASGDATLGADKQADIVSANSVNRAGGSGPINVTSTGGDARVFLDSLNTGLTTVDAGPTGTASIGVPNSAFTVGIIEGHNVYMAAGGAITATSVSVGGGDYTLIGSDFLGGTLVSYGPVRDLRIVDSNSMVINSALTADRNISLESVGGSVTVNAAITAGAGADVGDLSIQSVGDITVQSVWADQDISLYGVGGLITANTVTVGRDYRLTGGSFNNGALSPIGALAGIWTLTDTVGGLSLAGIGLNYDGGIVMNITGALTGGGTVFSSDGGITIGAASINLTNVNAAGGAVDLTTSGALNVNGVQATGGIDIDSGGVATFGNLTTAGSIDVAAAGNVLVANAGAGDDIRLASTGGTLTVERIEMSGAGAGHDLTLSSAGNLQIGAATTGAIGPFNVYSRVGTGATSIEARSGGVTANLQAAADFGAIRAQNEVILRVKTGDVGMSAVQSTNGGISLQADAGNVTVTNTLDAFVNLRIQANSVTLQTATAGGDLSLMAMTGDLIVGHGQAGDDATFFAMNGAATVRRVTLSGAGADIGSDGRNLSLTAGGPVTLGADSEGAITATNSLVRSSGTGYANVLSAGGDTNIFLQSSNLPITTLGGRAVTAVTATGDLSIGTLTATNAILKTPGNLTVANAPNISGDYSVTFSNFGGQALAPLSGVDDFTIVDTAGGLVIGNDIAVSGDLTIESAGMLSFNADLSAGGAISAESHGSLNILVGASLTSTATGDAIVLAADGGFNNQGGAGALSAANGRWLIYTQAQGAPGTPATNIFGGLAGKSFYGSTYDFATGTFSTAPNAGNRFVYGYRPVLTVTPGNSSVTYNGAIPIVTATPTGLVNGDLAGDAWSGQAAVSGATSKNVGTYSLAAALGSLASDMNYDFAFGTGLLTINPKALTGTVLVDDKTYDGNAGATGSISLGGVVAGDDVTAGATYAFADKNAGIDKAITVTGAALSGVDAGNYTLDPLAAAVADILRKALTGTVSASDKTYDGTTAATGSVSLAGVITGDDVSASGGTYAFADKTAGAGKTVTASGVGLSGGDAGNYTLDPLAAAIADILKKSLTGALTASSKTYDGATTATGSISLTGVITGDDVAAGGTYSFADANAGAGKTVTAGGVALSGADAANYDLTAVSTAIADILRKSLTGTLTASSKTYDGATTATGSVSLTGVIAGDDVSAAGTYAFADKNAGVGKTVTASGVSLSGTAAANYDLTSVSTAIADILRKSLTGALTASAKTYDGTTTATGSVSLTGVVTGDDVSAGGTYAFANKNAGVGKTVTATGVTLAGADAANYDLASVSTAIADILRKALTGTVVVQDKTYDGTTAANGSVTLAGVIAGDSVSAAGTYAFADANAGAGKTITVSGVSLSGADAGNYVLSPLSPSLASILRRAVAIQADDRTKRFGQSDPALTWTVVSGSLVQGDAASGALARADGEQIGTYVIGQGSLSLSQNYDLSFTPGAFVIEPMPTAGQDSSDAIRWLRQPRGYDLYSDPSENLRVVDDRGVCPDGQSCPQISERATGAGAF